MIGLMVYVVDSKVSSSVKEPNRKDEVEKFPSPSRILELFSQAALYKPNNGIVDLNCECTNTHTPLGSALSFSIEEDSFCTWTMKKLGKGGVDAASEMDSMRSLFYTLVNDGCIKSSYWSANTTELMSILTRIGVTYYWADYLAKSAFNRGDLCGFAFGTKFNKQFNQAQQLHNYTGLSDYCSFDSAFDPYFESSTSSIYSDLREKRLMSLLFSSQGVCSSVRSVRSTFEKTVSATEYDPVFGITPIYITTHVALEPSVLDTSVKTLFFEKMEQFGATLSSLIPGFSPSKESGFLEKRFATSYLKWYSEGFSAISDSDYLFSSRLPFTRTDFSPNSVIGGFENYWDPRLNNNNSRFFTPNRFFLRTPNVDSLFGAYYNYAYAPYFTGFARVVFRPNPLNVKIYPVKSFTGTLSSTQSVVVVGSDFLTLLDACALGESLSLEIFSLHPTKPLPGFSLPSTLFLNDHKQSCERGTSYSKPLMTIPVACPALLVEMGKARRESFYSSSNFSSPFRVTGEDILRVLGKSEYDAVAKGLLPSSFGQALLLNR